MTVNGFTSRDICAIIKECAKNGVNTFNFGELHVDFGATATSARYQNPEKVNQVVSVFPAPKDKNLEQQVIDQAVFQDTVDSVEDELATLQITDPHEYEELMFQEALGGRREPEEEKENGY
jgi:hypothetical protein